MSAHRLPSERYFPVSVAVSPSDPQPAPGRYHKPLFKFRSESNIHFCLLSLSRATPRPAGREQDLILSLNLRLTHINSMRNMQIIDCDQAQHPPGGARRIQ